MYTIAMVSQFSLLHTEQYLDDVISTIESARRSVSVMSLMYSDSTSDLQRLTTALIDAAHRGVDVSIACDLFFTYRALRNVDNRNITTMSRDLRSNGVRFSWLGVKSGLTLFSHRTHCKWIIIDDTVYSFGGINLYKKGVSSVDFMLKTKNTDIATLLASHHNAIIHHDKTGKPSRNIRHEVDKHTIYIDGGKILGGHSSIYRRAVELAKQSKSITFVSQYCPTGQLATLLKQKNATFYFNQWFQADSFHKLLIRWSVYSQKISTSYKKKDYLHAKYIIFDMPDGSSVALSGSHNFVAGGGWMGTREVALETCDEAIIEQLRTFTEQYVR